MRRAWVFLPLLLAGCKPGRQAAVTDEGILASTVDRGTFVAGSGRVAEVGEALALSPDGKSLAIAGKGGVTLWPSGRRIARMGPPLAWSPDGRSLAGTVGAQTVIWDLTTGHFGKTNVGDVPERLRWNAGGTLFAVSGREIQVDGGPILTTKQTFIVDAVGTSEGKIAYLGWDTLPDLPGDVLHRSLVRGEWDPASGALTTVDQGRVVDLFGAVRSGRLDVPLRVALAPNGQTFVVAAMRVEATPPSLTRMLTLADRTNPTKAERQEMETRLKAARLMSVVVQVDRSGRAMTLWTASSDMDRAVTDLEFSPNGKWLAIALPDATVRLAIQP